MGEEGVSEKAKVMGRPLAGASVVRREQAYEQEKEQERERKQRQHNSVVELVNQGR